MFFSQSALPTELSVVFAPVHYLSRTEYQSNKNPFFFSNYNQQKTKLYLLIRISTSDLKAGSHDPIFGANSY